MNKKIAVSAVVVIAFIFAGINANAAFPAKQAPDQSQAKTQDAMEKVKAANEIVKRAGVLLKAGLTKESMTLAMQLYLQAGQLYDSAGAAFKSIGKNVPKEAVMGCENAKAGCMKSAMDLRSRLQALK